MIMLEEYHGNKHIVGISFTYNYAYYSLNVTPTKSSIIMTMVS